MTLTRKAGIPVDRALGALDDLANWLIFTVDDRAMRDAAHFPHGARISFQDALLLAAARRLGATVLLTEDLDDGQVIAGVEIRNPFRSPRAGSVATPAQ